MKRPYPYLTLLIGTLSLFMQANSQATLDTSYATQINYIFANVDKSRIPYGILIDYGMEFTDLRQFNGTAPLADSNKCDLAAFYDVYNSLVMSRANNTVTIFSRQGNLDSIWFGYRQPGRITLMGLFVNYSKFKENASPNYITIINNRLYDKFVNGVWQNPYETERAFIICPSVHQYAGRSFEVLLPSILFIKNVPSYTLSIDFHDGQGYRTLAAGTPLNVGYADTGVYKWTYRINVGGTNYYCESLIHIRPSHSSNPHAVIRQKNKRIYES